jgi:hypothetical protein
MKYTLAIIAVALGLQAFAQSAKADSRLSQRFSQAQIDKMPEARISFWNFYLDQSYEIMDIHEDKAGQLQDLEVIDIASSDFDGFSIQLETYQKQGAYLRFKGENKMVMIKPLSQFIQEYNAQLK